MKPSVRIQDKNPDAIRKRMEALSERIRVRIGIQGVEASKDHGGATVADIAAIHEFGLGNVPVRSWLRGWYDGAEAQIREDLRKGMQKVIAGEISQHTLATALGLKGVVGIQERISSGIPPELSPETIDRKESATPLIDTGLFRSSITFVLDSGDMIGVSL